MSNPDCAWHEGAEGRKVGPDDDPHEGCQNCGKLIETKDCAGCGLTFLDFSIKDFDDVISGPFVTSDGDLMCIPCGRHHEQAVRDAEDAESARDGDWHEYYP
jgi:hypothetical protein